MYKLKRKNKKSNLRKGYKRSDADRWTKTNRDLHWQQKFGTDVIDFYPTTYKWLLNGRRIGYKEAERWLKEQYAAHG